MGELRAKANRWALGLILAAALLALWPPVRGAIMGWLLGMSVSLVINIILYRWVSIVTEQAETGKKKSGAAIFHGYGVRTLLALGVLAVAYVYPQFDLIATGLGLMSFPFLVYLVAFWSQRGES